MKNEFNAKEATLVSQIQAAIKKTLKVDDDPRERSNSEYFDHTAVGKLQPLAYKVADLIKEQGIGKTCAPLVSVARELKKLSDSFGDIAWNHPNSLGFAFKKALDSSGVSPDGTSRVNPFKGMRL